MGKVAYKFRKNGTDKNNWLIAVIYQYEQWRPSSLQGKGFLNPQFVREMTDIEKQEIQSSDRLLFYTYTDISKFLEDEKKYWDITNDFKEKLKLINKFK